MPAEETWALWTQYFRGRVGRWQPQKGEKQLADIKAHDEMKRWEIIGYGIAGLGVIIVIVGIALPSTKARSPGKRPPRRKGAATKP
jgi:hypothetical protein